jgi:tetratricopeptide (TPR) repeat protein
MNNIKIQVEQSVEIYLQVARTAADTGNEALSLRMCLAAHRRVCASPKLFSAKLFANIAELLLLNGQIDQAEQAYELAFKSQRKNGQINCWLTARICDGLTTIYISKAESEKALRACRLTVTILRKMPNVKKSLMVARVKRLAWLTAESGETLQAAALCREAASLTSDQVAPNATPCRAAALAQSALLAAR